MSYTTIQNNGNVRTMIHFMRNFKFQYETQLQYYFIPKRNLFSNSMYEHVILN